MVSIEAVRLDLELAQGLQDGWEELELVLWPGTHAPKVGWQKGMGGA